MLQVDVAIVGGGIGGTALGAALPEAGLDVLVLERTTSFEDRVRGEWIAPWGVSEAKQLGLYEPLRAAGGHVLTWHKTFDEDTPTAPDADALPLAMLHPDSSGPLCLEHVVMQDTLLSLARANGAPVLRGVSSVAIEPGSQPRVRYRHDGAEHEVRCRLIVGADGRASTVRRQAGIPLREDPIDHLISGLLIENADGWPEDLQATGRVGDFYYLAFPQAGGKVRLYADYGLEQRQRFAGEGGARAFLSAFDMDCVPHSQALAEGTPVGPCGAFPSQDAATDVPAREGVVLVGDAAGYNDPIIGQGISITLRDVRLVRDAILGSDPLDAAIFEPYANERRERLRRLRLTARFMTELNARFDPEANARRERARVRLESQPDLSTILLATFAGPDLLPAEIFDEQRIDALFAH